MFTYLAAALPLSEACLHSLYASLNAPVVQTDELGSGPCRAAIVIYAEDYGDLCLAVGLRSLESRRIAFYHFRDKIQDPSQIPAAMEHALCFAEGLGFLFDEDMIGKQSGAGRRQAFEHWLRLMGEGEAFASLPSREAADSTLDLMPPDEDLVPPMEELLEPAEELLGGRDSAREPATLSAAPSGSAATDGPARLPLTKFRGVAGEAAPQPAALVRQAEPSTAGSAASEGQGQALGRIAIVKRRRGDEAGRKGVLSRLLASF